MQWTALCLLVLINALATACTLVLDNRRGGHPGGRLDAIPPCISSRPGAPGRGSVLEEAVSRS